MIVIFLFPSFGNDSHISYRKEVKFQIVDFETIVIYHFEEIITLCFSAYVISEKITKFKKSSFLPPSYQNEGHISYQNEEQAVSKPLLSSACLPFSRRDGICQQYGGIASQYRRLAVY